MNVTVCFTQMEMFPTSKTLLSSNDTNPIAIVLEDWSDESYFKHNGCYIEDKAGTGFYRLMDDHPPCLKINGEAYSKSMNIFNYPVPPKNSVIHLGVLFDDCKPNRLYEREVDFENVGPYVLRYRLQKLLSHENPLFPVKYPPCQEENFYIDLRDGILMPGEKRKFTVAFKSKHTGIYQEEWEFTTDPAVHLNRIIFEFSALSHNNNAHNTSHTFRRDLTKLQAEKCAVDVLDKIIRKMFQMTIVPKKPSIVNVYTEKEAFLYLNGNRYYYDEYNIKQLKNFYNELTKEKWNLCMASFDDAMDSEDYNEEAKLKYKHLKLQTITPHPNILAFREDYPRYNAIFEMLGEAITDIQSVIDIRRNEVGLKPVEPIIHPERSYFYFPSKKLSMLKVDSTSVSTKKGSPTKRSLKGEKRKYIELVPKYRNRTETTSIGPEQETYAMNVHEDVHKRLERFVDDLVRELNKSSTSDYTPTYTT